jgi:MFS superfamily sulfate permease-like transporter
VPYFVIGGFLAATGWFLIAGGVRMTTGRTLSLSGLGSAWTMIDVAKLAAAAAALLVLLVVRRWFKSGFAMPAALLLMWLTGVGFLGVGPG